MHSILRLVREVPAALLPSPLGGLGPLPLALRVVARSGDSSTTPHWVAGSAAAAMLNRTSFRAFERGYVAEAPVRDIPRIGSAFKPKVYSSHPPNPLSILLSFLSEQPLSLSLFKRVAVDDNSQVHQ